VTTLIQKLYLEPIKEELIGRRVEELKTSGVLCAVSSIPQKAERYSAIAQEAHRSGRRVRDLVLERGLLESAQLDRILSPEGLVQPRLRDNV